MPAFRLSAVRSESFRVANYCLHALAGAGNLRSKTAVGRLVSVTLTGLRPLPERVTPAKEETATVGQCEQEMKGLVGDSA